MDFGEVTADPGADLDIFLGSELPGVLVPLDKLALDRLAHRHRRRRRGRVGCKAPQRMPKPDDEEDGRQSQKDRCRI